MFDVRTDLFDDWTRQSRVSTRSDRTGALAAIPVALEKPLSPWACRTLSAAAAFAIGFDSGPEPSSAGGLLKTLLGTWVMVIFLVFDIAHLACDAGELVKGGRPGPCIVDHCDLVNGAFSFVSFIPISNGLLAILLIAKRQWLRGPLQQPRPEAPESLGPRHQPVDRRRRHRRFQRNSTQLQNYAFREPPPSVPAGVGFPAILSPMRNSALS
jgi:hypothetical protein